MKSPREVLKKLYESAFENSVKSSYMMEQNPYGIDSALSDLSEIVMGICKEESFKWKDVKADNKFGVGVRAGIEAIEFRLSELFTDKEQSK